MAYRPKNVSFASVGGFTAGSVPFAASDGTLTEQNPGIVFTAASVLLELDNADLGGSTGTTLLLANQTAGNNGTPTFKGRKARGTRTSKTAVQDNDVLLFLTAEAWNSTIFSTGASIQFIATQTWTSSNKGAEMEFRVNKFNSTSTSQILILSHNGTNPIFDLSLSAGPKMKLDTTTGLMVGTSALEKVAFLGAAPIIQQASIASPVSDISGTKAAIDSILTVLEDFGFIAAN